MANKFKYMWVDIEFDEWAKQQAAEARKKGLMIGTGGVTQKLLEDIIKPNNIKINTNIKLMGGETKSTKKQIY